MAATRIVKELSYAAYKELIEKRPIRVSPHAYFRLSQMQRKVYKDETLIKMITEEKPAFIGIQQNQNYAVFFSRKKGYQRLMFKVTSQYIEVITFYLCDHIPKI